MDLDRSILSSALRHLAGVRYDAAGKPRAYSMDCTRATFAILRDVYGSIIDSVSPAIHIRNAGDPFSNVDAMIGLGLAKSVKYPGAGWSFCQGWRSLSPLHGGHAWLWWEPPTPFPGPGFIVQATPIQPWCERRTWGEQRGKFPAGVKVAQLREVSHV
jgi:hypothetical protein